MSTRVSGFVLVGDLPSPSLGQTVRTELYRVERLIGREGWKGRNFQSAEFNIIYACGKLTLSRIARYMKKGKKYT